MTYYFDAHIHLSDAAYSQDIKYILTQMRCLGIKACSVSTNIKDSLETIKIAKDYNDDYNDNQILPFIGIHPEYAEDDLEEMVELIQQSHKELAGIGEIGLDPTFPENDKNRQNVVFETQLACAEQFNKPVSVHSRKSLDRILDTMTSYDIKHVLIHWFDGSKKQLRRVMDMGFFVSYGPVTVYANDKQSLLAKTDRSKILVETDGPVRFSRCFEGRMGQISFIPSVILCASKILGDTFEETTAMLEKNTETFLGI